jgi:hypothetical protein
MHQYLLIGRANVKLFYQRTTAAKTHFACKTFFACLKDEEIEHQQM